MVGLSRVAARASGSWRTPGAPIRVVAVVGWGATSAPIAPGDAITWSGRAYRVQAVEGGDYLHVRPSDSPAG